MSRQNLFDPGIEPLAQGCASGFQPLRANLAIQQAGEKVAEALERLRDRRARFMVLRGAGKTQEFTHAHIVEALRARDVAAASQAMLDEISETREVILDRAIRKDGASRHLGD